MPDWLRSKFVLISRVAALLCLIAICVLSLEPGERVPLGNISDKYRHAAAYGVFALLVGCAFLNLRWRSVPLAFVVVSSIGVAIEIIQPFFGRTRDVYDALANATGAGIGCIALVGLATIYVRSMGDAADATLRRQLPADC